MCVDFKMSSEESCSDSCSESSSSSSSDHEGSEVLVEERQQNNAGITPWRFEPVGRRNRNENAAEPEEHIDDPPDRLNNNDWCMCENCTIMDRAAECVCCTEINAIKNKLREAVEVDRLEQEPACITSHPGFLAVCTNRWVLETAWYQYRQQYGAKADDAPEHKRNRHVAYRQLVRWCWGYLGREIRVVLPSCAVMCIRAHFPPPGLEEDFIFTGFRYADE